MIMIDFYDYGDDEEVESSLLYILNIFIFQIKVEPLNSYLLTFQRKRELFGTSGKV